MAFASPLCHSPTRMKIDMVQAKKHCGAGKGQIPYFLFRSSAEFYKQQSMRNGVNLTGDWSFKGGSRVIEKRKVARFDRYRNSSQVYASWLSGSQIASSVFTLGTVAVLPFYTLMVLAPKSQLTKRAMESCVPFVVLGSLYAFILYLSWTPETIQLIFASENLLPELTSIGKLFSSEMTLASAWIHLLVVDLFAARQIFEDGLENQIETRHSTCLCLFSCPIGILAHLTTKAMTKTWKKKPTKDFIQS